MGKRKIEIMDTTLRDGEQTSGVSFSAAEKLSIKNALIENLKEQTKLCIGLDITSQNELILTKNIGDWKKEITTDLKNKPCVFLLQS